MSLSPSSFSDVFVFNSVSVYGHSTLVSVMAMEEDEEYLLLFSNCLFEDNNGGGGDF